MVTGLPEVRRVAEGVGAVVEGPVSRSRSGP
jgi:hypothetical protein